MALFGAPLALDMMELVQLYNAERALQGKASASEAFALDLRR